MAGNLAQDTKRERRSLALGTASQSHSPKPHQKRLLKQPRNTQGRGMRIRNYNDRPHAASGVFAQYQPKYAAHGIATFPVFISRQTKKPSVKGYMTIGLGRSTQLARSDQKGDADAFGFVCGNAAPQHSQITILDIDTGELADALTRHGASPMIVQTASGKFHIYYRANGECRKIRPWPGCEIDLLGGGYAAASPSQAHNGTAYRPIQGSLDDLDQLPIMRGLELRLYRDYEQVITDDFLPPKRRPRHPIGRRCQMGGATVNCSTVRDPLLPLA